MELKEIYDLWDRFDKSEVAEFELETEELHLKLKKPEPVLANPCAANVASANTIVPLQQGAPVGGGETGTDENAASIKAPLVGVFYSAPSPDADPFVKEGQQIHKGDVIGIIEAMKLMNEVVADRDGVVEKIVVENGTPVEYDQPLMTIADAKA